MFDSKSDYALNKLDKDSIVCPSATGVHIRLTREDFASEEEFQQWKSWSDSDYHETENSGHSYYENCVPLTGSLKSVQPSVEEILLAPLHELEQCEKRTALLERLKKYLTPKQYRRLWMLYVENKSVAEIAALEGVSFQAIYVCLGKAQDKIVNNL